MNQSFPKIWIIIITILVLLCVGGEIFLYQSQRQTSKEVIALKEIIGIKEPFISKSADEILKEKKLKEEEAAKRLEEAKKAGNELNVPKPVGDWTLTVTNIRRITNAQAAPYLQHTTTNKDTIIIDLLFTAGSGCSNGCYVSTLINDYKLQTSDGTIMQLGEYSTLFESAPFVDRQYSGNQAFLSGNKGKHQAYFFAESGENDFIFSYYDSSSGETQFYRLKP